MARAGSRGDGWICSSRASRDDIRVGVGIVRDAAEEAGKARDAVRCVVRGVTVVHGAAVDDRERAPLQGSTEQIRDDLGQFAELGVDEVFLDLNFDSSEVGNPTADPARALDKANAVLESCGPAPSG